MFVPNATLARIVRSVVIDPSPRQIAKIRALSATGLVGTAAYGYYARYAGGKLPRRPVVSALAEDATSALVRLRFSDAEIIVRTMIAAAAEDDGTSAGDDRRILRYLLDAGATPGEFAYAEAETRRPTPPEELAEDVVDHETALELYAAALLATEGTTPAARRFLARLAHSLKLPPSFLGELHASWGEAAPTLTTPTEASSVQR